ncbi:MAG: maltotransferase domain-containing protein, partial [Fibrobacterota bacterium]
MPKKKLNKERPKILGSAVIEDVYPSVLNGRFAVKRITGEKIDIWADIFREGHGKCEARLLYREEGASRWKKSAMGFFDNDRWKGSLTAGRPGYHEFCIEAWPEENPKRITRSAVYPLSVDREAAGFASWYEMWPRSQGLLEGESATFKDMEKRIPYISDLGFDVIYLTPIHPIGRTKRKGPNNNPVCSINDPGCPYAIGNEAGGHKAVEPSLGTLKDFERFNSAVKKAGLEVALDIAHTCSPDHPYLKEHPEWFFHEKDGTIKCAVNPPKVYEDIIPFNFFCDDYEALWNEMLSIFTFWAEKG